jgi:hypothetical protein
MSPLFNKIFEDGVCCEECNHETKIFVKLHMSLSLHAGLEKEDA